MLLAVFLPANPAKSSPAWPSTTPEPAEKESRGLSLPETIKALEAELERRPDSLELQLELGGLLRANGQLVSSRERLRKAWSLAPGTPSVCRELALTSGELGDFAGARRYAELWLDSEPASAAAAFLAGWSSLWNGDSREAVSDLRKARQHDGGDLEIQNALGVALLDAGKFAEAKSQLESLLLLQPDHLAARLNLATLYLCLQDSTGALEILRGAAPEKASPPLLALEAYTLATAQRWQESRRRAQEALSLEADQPLALVALARVLSAEGDEAAAIEKLRRAARAAPQTPLVLCELSAAHLRAGEAKSALDLAQQALQIAPVNLDAKAAMAMALVRLGNLDGAYLLLSESAARKPGSLRFRLALASTLESMERFDDAKESYSKARRIDPYAPAPLLGLARISCRAKRFQEARRLAEKVLEVDPHNLEARRVLARALLAVGSTEAALVNAERLTTDSPSSGAEAALYAECLYRLRRFTESAGWYARALAAPDGQLDDEQLLHFADSIFYLERQRKHRGSRIDNGALADGPAGLAGDQTDRRRTERSKEGARLSVGDLPSLKAILSKVKPEKISRDELARLRYLEKQALQKTDSGKFNSREP